MGRVLTIRLHAGTYDEEDVFRSWPELCALAWPGKGEVTRGGWEKRPEPPAAIAAPEPVRRGVLELAHSLGEEFRFGGWETAVQNRLRAGMDELDRAVLQLETALGDWRPQAADAAAYAIEDALDKLERELE
ncbi:MAG: hypothetical protein LBV01_04035 [Deltaproteobacteria bacterium]|nr:hypothetical protein [Deltaproteobacteria bacterium]